MLGVVLDCALLFLLQSGLQDPAQTSPGVKSLQEDLAITTCDPEWTNGFALPANGPVYDMLNFDDGGGVQVYVGGAFTSIAGLPAQRVARWNGIGWSALGDGFNGAVMALEAFSSPVRSEIYAGG